MGSQKEKSGVAFEGFVRYIEVLSLEKAYKEGVCELETREKNNERERHTHTHRTSDISSPMHALVI